MFFFTFFCVLVDIMYIGPFSTAVLENGTIMKFIEQYCKVCLAKARTPPSSACDAFIREPHKYFDEVVITVRAGDGGHGAVLSMPNVKAPSKSQGKFDREKTKRKPSYKRDFDGSLILPMGGHGGDVVIYADESKDTLLEFHKGNVDAMGVLTSYLQNGLTAPTLRILVPLGLFFF